MFVETYPRTKNSTGHGLHAIISGIHSVSHGFPFNVLHFLLTVHAAADRTGQHSPDLLPDYNSPPDWSMPDWFTKTPNFKSCPVNFEPRPGPVSVGQKRSSLYYHDVDQIAKSDYAPFAIRYPQEDLEYDMATVRQEDNSRMNHDTQRFYSTPQIFLSIPPTTHVQQSVIYIHQLPPSPVSPKPTVVLPQYPVPAVLHQRDNQTVLRSQASRQISMTNGSSSPPPVAQRAQVSGNKRWVAAQQPKSTKRQKTTIPPSKNKTPAVHKDNESQTEPTSNSPTIVKSSTGKEKRRISSVNDPESPAMGPMAKRVNSGSFKSQTAVSHTSNGQVTASMNLTALSTPVVVAKDPHPVHEEDRVQISVQLSTPKVAAQPVHIRSQVGSPTQSVVSQETTTKKNVASALTVKGAQPVHNTSQAQTPVQSPNPKANTTPENLSSSSLIVRGAQSVGAGTQVEIQTQYSASKAVATIDDAYTRATESPASSLATRYSHTANGGSEVELLAQLSLASAPRENASVHVSTNPTSSPSKEPKCSYCDRPDHQIDQCTACTYCTGRKSCDPGHALHQCLFYERFEHDAFMAALYAHFAKAEFVPPEPSHRTRLKASAGFNWIFRSSEDL